MSSYIYEVVKTDLDMPVRCFGYDVEKMFFVAAHWHNSLEVIRMVKGCMTVTGEERGTDLREGELLIINSREVHATLTRQECRVEVVQIPYPFLKHYMPGVEKYRFREEVIREDTKEGRLLGESIHRTVVSSMERADGYRIEFHEALFRLMGVLYRQRYEVGGQGADQGDSNRRRLTRIMDYLNTHYRERITLEMAAGQVALNKEYFCRFFKKYMGISMGEYLQMIRFTHACDQLFATEDNIMLILEENGFHNYRLFMKMFREKYGTTPAKRRKMGK